MQTKKLGWDAKTVGRRTPFRDECPRVWTTSERGELERCWVATMLGGRGAGRERCWPGTVLALPVRTPRGTGPDYGASLRWSSAAFGVSGFSRIWRERARARQSRKSVSPGSLAVPSLRSPH